MSMNKGSWLWGCAAATLIPLAVACGGPTGGPGGPAPGEDEGPPKYGGVLNLAQGQPPQSWDAHQEVTLNSVGLTSSQYDQLLQYDSKEGDKILPDLAERWDVSPDGKTMTFFLRRGVRFHNGNPFTAQDVKFTLDRLRDPPEGVRSNRQNNFEPIESVSVGDDHTVRVHLKRPYPALLGVLALGYHPMYDKEWVEANGHEITKKEVMGTGPYKFKEYVRGVSYEAVKNPDYWQKDRPFLDGLKTFVIPDAGTVLASFRSGRLHLAAPGTREEAESMAKELEGQIRYLSGPGYGPSALALNVKRQPMDNLKVRQAIGYALNRHDALKVMTEEVLAGPFPPPWGMSSDELAKYPGYGTDRAGDLAKAKQLLAEAGYANGFTMDVVARRLKRYQDVGIISKEALGKIGVTVNLRVLDDAAFYDATYKADFGAVAGGYNIMFADPDAQYTELWMCGSDRTFGACDPEMDALYIKQSSTLDVNERKRLVRELEHIMLSSNYKAMIGRGTEKRLVWNAVRSYYLPGGDVNNRKYTNVWLAQ